MATLGSLPKRQVQGAEVVGGKIEPHPAKVVADAGRRERHRVAVPETKRLLGGRVEPQRTEGLELQPARR